MVLSPLSQVTNIYIGVDKNEMNCSKGLDENIGELKRAV